MRRADPRGAQKIQARPRRIKKTDSTKLDQIIAMLGDMNASMERSFAAVADDIADIKRDLATKDDMRAIVREEIKDVRSELASIRRDLDRLSANADNVLGYRKEIDYALDRIAAIEKHLGHRKKDRRLTPTTIPRTLAGRPKSVSPTA